MHPGSTPWRVSSATQQHAKCGMHGHQPSRRFLNINQMFRFLVSARNHRRACTHILLEYAHMQTTPPPPPNPASSPTRITTPPTGPDDMPAHIKASMMGPSVTIPITKGRLNLGTWQVGALIFNFFAFFLSPLLAGNRGQHVAGKGRGPHPELAWASRRGDRLHSGIRVRLCMQGIWLCEHRHYGGPRRLVITLQGE
jgi:hypothetical protein